MNAESELAKVGDNESVYRRVPCYLINGNKLYRFDGSRVVVSSQAFTDRNLCPSVDRAILKNNDPRNSQVSAEDGVISLICKQVREIDDLRSAPGTDQEIRYKIDIIWRPIDGNEAHAQVEPDPEYKSKSVFRRLREKLAFLANQREWEIYPADCR
jgi:hypothetical protein